MTNLPVPQNTNLLAKSNPILDAIAEAAEAKVDKSLSIEKQDAQRIHYLFTGAARAGKSIATMVRNEAAQMYISGLYLELELPYADSDDKLTFADFPAWLGFAVDQAGLSESTASALKGFILNVVDPVAKGLVINPKTAKPYSLDEVLNLRESDTQKLGSVAKRVLLSDGLTDQEKFDKIAELVDLSKTSTYADFVDALHDVGLVDRRTDPIAANVAYVNDKVVYVFEIPADLQPLVNSWMANRFTQRTRTTEDIVASLMNLQITDTQLEEATAPMNDSDDWELPDEEDDDKNSDSEPTTEDMENLEDWLNNQ